MNKVWVYTLCYNEVAFVKNFLAAYKDAEKIIVYDNYSTDGSVELLSQDSRVEIRKYDSGNQIRDDIYLKIKNNCWKEARGLADWVMIVDADEFIYHKNIINILNTTDATVLVPTFYDMYSEKFPTTKGQIYEEVCNGTRGDIWDRGVALQRINIFKPNEITEINYGIGCHTANPQGNVKIGQIFGLFTLHMKYLSRKYVIERHARNSKRLSSVNRQQGWGLHSDWSVEFINKKFDDNILNLIKVL